MGRRHEIGICLVRKGCDRRVSRTRPDIDAVTSLAGSAKLLGTVDPVSTVGLLVAVGLHARCSGGFGVGSSGQCLGVSLVENGLDNLLLLGTEDLGQTVI